MGGMALALGLSSNFVELAVGSSVVRLLGYIICIGALPVIRRQASPEQEAQAWRLRGGLTVPILALGVCGWLVAQSKGDDWIRVGVLLAIGIALYAVEKWYYARD